jgi:hypothetical protein
MPEHRPSRHASHTGAPTSFSTRSKWYGVSPEEARNMGDVFTTKVLLEDKNTVLLWAEPGSTREALIRRHLGSAATIMRPRKTT